MRESNRDTSRLVRLFAERRDFYSVEEVCELAQLTPDRLHQAIADGTVELAARGPSTLIAWEELVSLVLRRWTPRQIAEVLRRAGHAEALPPLNRFHTITIELPVYQLRLLHYLAEQRRKPLAPPLTASDVLEYELSALAFEEDLAAIDRVIPGFAAAANYPSLGASAPVAAEGCVFCGQAIRTPGDLCERCTERHLRS